ncbi:hypothetical protein B0H19DRAFT_1241694 [Mycena capillaripes]|nr:hypothetical protein B0H19DRAFT_1241694 [Mycena capillaripes]
MRHAMKPRISGYAHENSSMWLAEALHLRIWVSVRSSSLKRTMDELDARKSFNGTTTGPADMPTAIEEQLRRLLFNAVRFSSKPDGPRAWHANVTGLIRSKLESLVNNGICFIETASLAVSALALARFTNLAIQTSLNTLEL